PVTSIERLEPRRPDAPASSAAGPSPNRRRLGRVLAGVGSDTGASESAASRGGSSTGGGGSFAPPVSEGGAGILGAPGPNGELGKGGGWLGTDGEPCVTSALSGTELGGRGGIVIVRDGGRGGAGIDEDESFCSAAFNSCASWVP